MAGLSLQTQFGNAYPGARGTNAGASPQGPVTAAEAGFGVAGGAGGGKVGGHTMGVLSVGVLAFLGLAFIWWSLPR